MIKAELLQDADDAQAKLFLMDGNYVWQEKHNGDRRLIEKNGDIIRDFNRDGEPGKGLPPKIIAALKAHPLHKFVIDVEYVYVGEETIYVFDMLYAGEEVLVGMPYSTRLQYMYAHFDHPHSLDKHKPCVQAVLTARNPKQKVALMEYCIKVRAEGFVMKNLRAPYRPGARFNWRFKFVKELDAVVIGDSTERDDMGMLKNSVRLGLYMPNGFLKDICGATKKSIYTLNLGPQKSNAPLMPGDVVEIAYLYGTGTDDVVQPRIQCKRTDKKASACTVDQIVRNKNWRKR